MMASKGNSDEQANWKSMSSSESDEDMSDMSEGSDSREDEVCRKKRTKYEKDNVSNWDKDKIQGMSIRYDDNTSDVTDIFQKLKNELKEIFHKEIEVPRIASKLIEISKEIMDSTLSFDTEFLSGDWATEVSAQIFNCRKAQQKIKEIDVEQQFGIFGKANKFLLQRWKSRLFDFYTCYQKFLIRCFQDKDKITEKVYVGFLKDFTRLFFLDPEDGRCRESSIKIKGVFVSCMPDIRYAIAGSYNKELFSVIVAEEKNKRPTGREMLRQTTFNINTALGNSILGHHAGVLLLESENSYFSREGITSHSLSFGMICMKTEIIFTCMKIELEHISKIAHGHSVDDQDCVIKYTRPFNFMMSEDREEIMEHLFWLGFLQQDESE